MNDVRRGLERTHCTPFMEILNRQFGLAIAYLLPGFIALLGIAPFAPVVTAWLKTGQTASLGAPVYAILASIAAGMVVSCFRWFLLDPLVTLTGVGTSPFNTKALEQHPAALNFLIESHYRYYQFYGGTLLAAVWTYLIYRVLGTSPHLGFGTDFGMVILCAVLFAGARDTLSKYRNRSNQLVGTTLKKE